MNSLSSSRLSRNTTLDFMKLFAAYMAVFIHIGFSGTSGLVIEAIARFAVPLFFISSGYYCYNNSQDRIKKKISKTVLLFVTVAIICNLYTVFSLLSNGDSILVHYSQYMNLWTLIKFLALNSPISSVHLWFLLALIYCYIIRYFICRFNISDKPILILSLIAILINLILGEGLSAFRITVPEVLVRNFIFTGYPFFHIGVMLRKHEERICLIKNQTVILFAVLGVCENIIAVLLFGRSELYLGSVFISVALMIFAVKYPQLIKGHKTELIAACSTNIYLFHLLVASFVSRAERLFGVPHDSLIYTNIKPIIVCALTTLLALIIKKTADMLKAVKDK